MYIKRHGSQGRVVFKKNANILREKFRLKSDADVILVLRSFPNCTVEEKQDKDAHSVTALTVTFTNWNKYQGDNSLERVRRFRERVTPKKRREEKRREESKTETANAVSSSAAPRSGTAAKEWPESDLWIPKFLETQTSVNLPPAHLKALQNPDFWERTSEACGGIDLALLQVEFAKMGNWLIDHPSRVPTAKGIRRFVSGWLERTYEKERRYGGQRQTTLR
jgi:hypothetical protein